MKHSIFKTSLASATLLGLGLSVLYASPTQADDSDSLKQQVQDLDQKVRVLQRKLENADEEAAKSKSENAVVVAGDKGFGLKSADGKFDLKLRGLIQADARVFNDGIKGQPSGTPVGTVDDYDNFLLRRVRPTVEGTFNEVYGFRITPDFGNGATSLVDAYVDANNYSFAKVRVGKFTPPLEFERLQSSADTKFNELALTSVLVPSRDVGVQVSGDLFTNVLNYGIGLFDGANDGSSGDNDTNNAKEVVARLFAQPLINHPGVFQNLGVGIGYSHTGAGSDLASGAAPQTINNTYLGKYADSGQETFFTYRSNAAPTTVNTVYASSHRNQLVPQISYYYGGLGVVGEYVKEQQGVSLNLRNDELTHHAWQVTTSYLLTGEEASSKGVKPINDFNPATGGWGAWELAARVSELDLDKKTFYGSTGLLGDSSAATASYADPVKSAQNAHNVAAGINWYLNKVLRVSLDYEKTTFKWGGGGTATNPLDRPNEDVLIGRVQASF